MPRFSPFALALAFAILAVYIVIAIVQPIPAGPGDDDRVDVLVVQNDLPVNTVLDESAIRVHLGRSRERRDRLPPGPVADELLVQGKTALRNIRAGEYLSDTDVGHPIVDSIPDNWRAMSVQLSPDDRGADALRPGDRVDLVLVVRIGGGQVTSESVVQGLLVLGVNTADKHVVVMTTSTAQAQALRAAEERGDLRAVRSGDAK
jgi:Flp pilus assembly protein CpaB